MAGTEAGRRGKGVKSSFYVGKLRLNGEELFLSFNQKNQWGCKGYVGKPLYWNTLHWNGGVDMYALHATLAGLQGWQCRNSFQDTTIGLSSAMCSAGKSV